jgi:hypothetical protein
MNCLFLFLFIGIIGVECSLYYVIPSEFTGNNIQNKKEINLIFFGIVSAYFLTWCWIVCKKTYGKEKSDEQWSKFMNIVLSFVFQVVWYIIICYLHDRIILIFDIIISCIAFIYPVIRLIEIKFFRVKVFFFIVSMIQILAILAVSIEYIIYEKIITYSWIVAYYFYPIYLAIFAFLFVKYTRWIEVDSIPSTT